MSNSNERVEFITGRERRRSYSAAEKVGGWAAKRTDRDASRGGILAAVAASGRFPLKAVADTLGVARLNSAELTPPAMHREAHHPEA
jgi:hypothetical protein